MRVGLAFLCLILVSTFAFAAEIPGSSFQSGVWKGNAFTFDENGRFSHCSISTPYQSGDVLYFFSNADGSFNIGVSRPQPAYRDGQVFPISITVDRRAPIYGEGVAYGDKFVILRIYDAGRAVEALKRGKVLRILEEERRSVYNLGGTFKALDTAKRCVAYYQGYVGAPVAKAPPASPAPEASPLDQTLLYQIATNMIAGYGITDSRYLRQEEVDSFTRNPGVFWTSDYSRILGGVYYGPSGGIEHLRESDALDMRDIAGGCTGDLATTARDLEPEDGIPGRLLRAVCSAETEIQHAEVRKYLMGDIILYVMVMHIDPVGSTVPERREEERRQLGQTVAARAVSMVVESR